MSTLDLTIAIPAKNDAKLLSGCLQSIGPDLAREVVVIDSGSTDDTAAIAQSFGARLINFDWDRKFPKKRNWYLRNHTPTTTWILFLDADEYLTEAFKTELRAKLSNQAVEGYWLNYTVYWMGKQLKGGYPLKKLALFKVGKAEYERIDEDGWSNLDMEVHEHPIVTGNIGKIKSKIDHRDMRGVTSYVTKHVQYAAWEAARFQKNENDVEKRKTWTFMQKLKYRFITSVLMGPAYFVGTYILYGGFLDGAPGLSFAIMKMSYFTQIYTKIREDKDAAGV